IPFLPSPPIHPPERPDHQPSALPTLVHAHQSPSPRCAPIVHRLTWSREAGRAEPRRLPVGRASVPLSVVSCCPHGDPGGSRRNRTLRVLRRRIPAPPPHLAAARLPPLRRAGCSRRVRPAVRPPIRAPCDRGSPARSDTVRLPRRA